MGKAVAEIFRKHEELPGNWNKQPEALFSGAHTANPFNTAPASVCVYVCVCDCDKNCWSLLTPTHLRAFAHV